jgi:hypothetical protein
MCHTSVICSNHISKLKYSVQRDHWKEETMRKLYICSAVIGAVVLGIATAAVAEEYKKADALSVAQGKPKRTECTIKEDIDTKTYCFGDEASKAEFMKDAKANISKADSYWQPCKEGIAELCTATNTAKDIDGSRGATSLGPSSRLLNC